MLTKPHYERTLTKLRRFEEMLNPYLFVPVTSLPVRAWVADKQYHSIPDESLFTSIEPGWPWSGEGNYCWIRSEYTVPEELDGQNLYIMPKMSGYEAMLWVNGVPYGTFNTKIVYTAHGNHYCDLLKLNARAGETIDIAIEYYAGHDCPGCMPFDNDTRDYQYSFEDLIVCTKDAMINQFYFDLKTVNQLAAELPDSSFFKGRVINTVMKLHEILYYSIEDIDTETFRSAIEEAQPYLTEILSETNAPNAPSAGIIGHSHMDTAWLWHIGETVKKCARTYANEISLMDQYPEYRFVQSSSCHSDMIRRNYPDLFAKIQEKVAEGRYEPNGAVWVECDCNITGGEAMIRQFLWGQRFTRKYFNYTSDSFWLPDTFGYSAAIPQIMKGCGVDYFLTTKISWNDTNMFPYDTFYWQGIDGTKVFSHFNLTHAWPDVETLRNSLIPNEKNLNHLKQTSVNDKRLISYGFGDGGGGPQFEMIEMSRRVADLNEVPRAYSTTVSDFMKDLEATSVNPNTYRGELYLELHRGTLTNQHEIKRNNRKAEQRLRDLEFLTTAQAVEKKVPCSAESNNDLYETLLINQFHDILPGTCINKAHVQCREEMSGLINNANERIDAAITGNDEKVITFTNTLSFDRSDVIFADEIYGNVEGAYQQKYTDLEGKFKTLLSGITVPALSTKILAITENGRQRDKVFTEEGNRLSTPYYEVEFDENGYIASLYDKKADRQLVNGMPLNTFLMAEDVPLSWDNWDIDPDLELKFKPCAKLTFRETTSTGDVAHIITSRYQLTDKSWIRQDMMFFADSPEIRLDTRIFWQDHHRFLKTAWDVNVSEDFARHEIQFGYCKRPTTRNNSIEQAKFEVVNHKYTDLSEPGYGVAILNDCKYGISVSGNHMALSLHKGGTRPDRQGDVGYHSVAYSFLPHDGGFSAENVIQPAYTMNIPCLVSNGRFELPTLLKVDRPNIIVEAIKPCEDEARAFIVRLYEAEGTGCTASLQFCDAVTHLEETNMLEETLASVGEGGTLKTKFRPFEIKTLKAYY